MTPEQYRRDMLDIAAVLAIFVAGFAAWVGIVALVLWIAS